MRGVALQVILVLTVMLAISLIYGELTGNAARARGPYAVPYSAHAAKPSFHTEREITSIEIIGKRITKEGLPLIEQGGILSFVIRPGKQGAHTGYQIENAVSGLRVEGDHCSRGKSADFCSTSYSCVDTDPRHCSIVGSKCYGDKLVTLRIPPTQKLGHYV